MSRPYEYHSCMVITTCKDFVVFLKCCSSYSKFGCHVLKIVHMLIHVCERGHEEFASAKTMELFFSAKPNRGKNMQQLKPQISW